MNCFEYSGARGVSLLFCPAACRVSGGGLPPALCLLCINMAGLPPREILLQDLVLGVL